jgi:hypothetical protein
MKIIITALILAVGMFFSGCEKRYGFPEQIGAYSKKDSANAKVTYSFMKSGVIAIYRSDDGSAVIDFLTYKDEKYIKQVYALELQAGRHECQFSGLIGSCETELSNSTVKVSFRWRDKNVMKTVYVNKPWWENDNKSEIEARCKEDLPLIISAVKGL